MRFISILRAPETLGFPPPLLAEQLAMLTREASRSGALVEAGALLPAATATWVTVKGGELAVVDSPRWRGEPVAGYAVYEVASRQEVVDWSNRVMRLHRTSWPGWCGEAEIRQVVPVVRSQ